MQAQPLGADVQPAEAPDALLPLTVPEVRRLVLALAEAAERRAFRLAWSRWRRKHQLIAARCYATRRPDGRTPPCAESGMPRPATAEPVLSEAEWARVLPLLPSQRPTRGRPRHDHRTVLSGILWVLRMDASWRAMPVECGKWETAYQRYRLWRDEGRWQRIAAALGIEEPEVAP